MAKDETEEGITGLPIPKKKMSPKKRHEFEKKRRVERKKRGDERVGDTFSQHRMTGSRGSGSEYENIRSVREELFVDYLLGEGFASDEKSAQEIAGVMSEEWKQSIVEQLNPDLPGGTYSDFQKNHELQKKLSGMSSADRKKYIDNLPRVGPDGKRLKGV
jgi:hypothetical protein